MSILPVEFLEKYRAETFRLPSARKVKTREQAIEFVNERGFVFFWPIKDFILPSLWVAVAGSRPVADEHDDPGHITWGWKDELLDKKVWYYGRILRKRNTILSLEILPNFYALSPNFGEPELDYLDQYNQGLMTQEAKLVFEALLKEGPLDSISLRKASRLTSSESSSRFNRALDSLQAEFKILPTGIAQAGAWKYAFIYDLTHRHLPDLIPSAGAISEHQARRNLIVSYLASVGAARITDIQKLFGWRPEDVQRSVQALEQQNAIVNNVEIEKQKGKYLVLSKLFKNGTIT